jgi:hypothetical protein
MTKKIVFIVEGHGEVEAIPVLARRFFERHEKWDAYVLKPIRVPRDRFLNREDEQKRILALAKAKAGDEGHIFVVVDADDDCPAQLSQRHLATLTQEVAPTPISFVAAKKEYECWFIGAAESLRGLRGLAVDLVCPPDPEAIRNAKGWLTERMDAAGAAYSETLDQPALSQEFDIDAARRTCASFDKFCREIARAIGV